MINIKPGMQQDTQSEARQDPEPEEWQKTSETWQGAYSVTRHGILSETNQKNQPKTQYDFQPEEKKAVKKAMNLLLHRDRSEKELHERLLREGYSEAAVQTAEEYVRSFGYLNDRRYAENYVASFYGKKSRMALSYDLRVKGISERWIEAALEEIPEDETDIIMELLKKKAGEPHHMEEKELRRCSAFLARKGYKSGDIWKVIREYQSMAEDGEAFDEE